MKCAEAFSVELDRPAVGLLGAVQVVGQDEEAAEVVLDARVGRPLGDERALRLDGAIEVPRRRGVRESAARERGARREVAATGWMSLRKGESFREAGGLGDRFVYLLTGFAFSLSLPSSVAMRNCTASQPVLSRIDSICCER